MAATWKMNKSLAKQPRSGLMPAHFPLLEGQWCLAEDKTSKAPTLAVGASFSFIHSGARWTGDMMKGLRGARHDQTLSRPAR